MSSVSVWQRIPLAVKIFIVGALVVAAIILLKPRPEPRPETEPPRPQVNVTYAQPQTLAINVKTQGTVAPRRQIDLVSQIAGPITQVANNFVNGGFFATNETLIQIDPREYQYALTRAQARIAEAERVLASERGAARHAQREWRELGDVDANALFLRKPQIAAAEAAVAAAKAERDQAQLNLERTTLRAPFAGRVQQTHVNLGQHLTPGARIATIFDSAFAEVRLPLTDQQSLLVDLPLGANHAASTRPQVSLRGVVAGQNYEWRGEIARTDASLDPQSRMYYAVVEIPEPFNTERWAAPLLVGMYVEAHIDGRALDNVIRLPKTSIFRRDKIYTLDAELRVQLKTVHVLDSNEDFVWIQGELTEGEAVVINRQGYINPGVLVSIAPEIEAVPSASSVTMPAASATQ